MQDKPLSKRGMLSELSSVYDPLGFVARFLLHERKIIQILSQQELGWDEIVSDEVAKDCVKWKTSLGKPSNFKMHKSSRVWRVKEKFHSPLFGCFRRRL